MSKAFLAQADSLTHQAVPTSLYERRPPSPPNLLIPHQGWTAAAEPKVILPCLSSISEPHMREVLLPILSTPVPPAIHQYDGTWTYNSRKLAHPICQYLYLGPSSRARDRNWLVSEGITNLVVVRSREHAESGLLNLDKVAADVSITVDYLQVDGLADTIRAIPAAVNTITQRLYESHQQRHWQPAASPDKYHGPKILVTCETGNDRSAVIVVAYLMAMYELSMIQAIQFTQGRRQCAAFDVDTKQMLKTWEELVAAHRDVGATQGQALAAKPSPLPSHPPGQSPPPIKQIEGLMVTSTRPSKRAADRITAEEDGDSDATMVDDYTMQSGDAERFAGRASFVPFVDTSG